MNTRRLAGYAVSAALAGLVLGFSSAASANVYTESITANPADLSCATANDHLTCYAYTVFVAGTQLAPASGTWNGGSGIFVAGSGDTVSVDVSFTSPLVVPNSPTESLYFVELGVVGAGTSFVPADSADVTSTLSGYVGPADPLSTYTSANYEAVVGHTGPFGNPGGFSLSGVDTNFSLNVGQPDPFVYAVYGYQVAVPEPAAWTMMLLGLFGLGAALRSRRRQPAGAVPAG
jgi:hypothetical protein